MGNAVSNRALDNTLTPPPGYVVPSFPSLYNPTLELAKHRDDPGDNPGMRYLYNSEDIYRFTLYWTLILYCPTYLLCGLYALLVHTITKRSISTLSLLAPLMYTLVGLLFAVVSSAVIGYALAAVYSVGLFSMSTWVPFLWAFVLTLVGVMGSYSTIITIL